MVVLLSMLLPSMLTDALLSLPVALWCLMTASIALKDSFRFATSLKTLDVSLFLAATSFKFRRERLMS